jgi:hypothetical protein
MQVVDLDGNSYNWQLTGNIAHGSNNKKSSLHLGARRIIHEIYPTLQILEEVQVVLRKSEYVYMDFYIPLIKKCIEVHGEQHYKFNRFYHHNLLGFVKHQKRDREKKEWCELNNIEYIELPFDKENDWKEILKS